MYAILLAFFNRARGSGLYGLSKKSIVTKLVSTLAMALTSAAIVSFTWYNVLIIWAGLMFWCTFGWGKYFSAFHGRDSIYEIETTWIDRIGYKIIPAERAESLKELEDDNRLRGMLCMSIRGGLFSIPMFAALSFTINPYAILIGLLMFLQGPIYYLMQWVKEQYAVFFAEIGVGVLFYAIFKLLKRLKGK